MGKAAAQLERMAKAARGASGEVDYSMMEARHGVMLLGEEFGVHLPRGITTFIAGLGPVGAAMETAFPFLAIGLGATLLLEHLHKVHEEAEKMAQAQAAYATTSAEVMRSLGDRLLEVQIKADALAGNGMARLKKELELIDHQSLNELKSEFDKLAASAEKDLVTLKTHWFEFRDCSVCQVVEPLDRPHVSIHNIADIQKFAPH